MSCDLQDKWSSVHVKTVQIAAHEDASRLLDWEDDAQSYYSEMVGFVERSLEVLFQAQTSKNPYITKGGNPCECKSGGGVIIFKWPGGFRANLPYLAGGVTLLYVRPIFQPPPPRNYCTVSNFRFHFYAFFVSLLGTSLFFFFLLVSKVPRFSSLSMSEKLPGCSI